VHHVDIGHRLKQFAKHMVRTTSSGRSHVDLAGIGLGVGNEIRNAFGWKRWIRQHQIGHAHNARDRGDVANKTEIELVGKGGVDCVSRTGEKERITIDGTCDCFSCDKDRYRQFGFRR